MAAVMGSRGYKLALLVYIDTFWVWELLKSHLKNASQWQHTLGWKAVYVHYTELVEINEIN